MNRSVIKLPKVLILNETFNSDNGGGITLSNLFSQWDNNKIAVLCSSHRLQSNVNTKICRTYYQLGSREMGFVFPFGILSRKRFSGLVNVDELTLESPAAVENHANFSVRHKIVVNYLFPFLEYTGFLDRITTVELSTELRTWLDEYNPDVIYAQAHTISDINLILLIKAYVKKPLVFHMMDDWPLMVTGSQALKTKQLKRNDRAMRKLLAHSDLMMSISDGMTNAYKSRYGKDFVPFHNPTDIDFWKKSQRSNYELSDSPTLLYAGRVGLGIDTSLEQIAQAVDLINTNLDLKMKFILQAKDNPAWSTNYACVQHRGFVSYDDLPKMFSEADLLILPYDFSPKSIQYIGYSMPTKATEYMISGSPIIIFSPEQTALVSYARKFEWALVITDNNINTLSEAIISLIQDQSQRERLGKMAIQIAEEHHSLEKVVSNFRTALSKLRDFPEL